MIGNNGKQSIPSTSLYTSYDYTGEILPTVKY